MRAFQTLIDQHFGFLCDVYGFARVANHNSPGSYAVFRKDDVEIIASRNRGEFIVQITMGGPPTIGETDSYFIFDLWCFAVDRDGEEHTYRYRIYDSDAELTVHLEEEMATAANALRKYGIDVVEGRFDDWKGLRHRLKERWNRMHPPKPC